jgi:hypothetical protein
VVVGLEKNSYQIFLWSPNALKSQKNLISKKLHPTASSNPIEVPPATMSADAQKKFDKEKVMPTASSKPEVPPATMPETQKNLITKKITPTASSKPEVPPATMSAELSPATADAQKKFDKEKVMPTASSKPEVPPATMSATKKPCSATLAIVNQIIESREDAMKEEMEKRIEEILKKKVAIVNQIIESREDAMKEEMEKRIEEISKKKVEEVFDKMLCVEKMFSQMLGDRQAEPVPKPKKSAKGGESADADVPAEKAEGYYEVSNPLEEIRRLRTINKELRKESEGKTKTNQLLRERIADLEGDDAITKYAQEIERLKGINQEMRKRCVGKDNTNQKLKAELDALKKKYCPEPEDE